MAVANAKIDIQDDYNEIMKKQDTKHINLMTDVANAEIDSQDVYNKIMKK